MLVSVRAEEGVEPTLTASALRLLNNRVVRALRDHLGDGLLLPSMVRLRAPDDSRPDGEVPATANQDGAITAVGNPVVNAIDNDALLGWAFGHELAHYHELETRRRSGLRIPNRRASELWSEYFAQRTVCAAGLMVYGEHLETAPKDSVPAKQAVSDRPVQLDGRILSWWKGEHDADPDFPCRYPVATQNYLSAVMSRLSSWDLLPELHDRFPSWSPEDAASLARYCRALDQVEHPAGGKPRSGSR